jgi:hypothetical protein
MQNNESENDITLMGSRDDFERLADDAYNNKSFIGVNETSGLYGGVNKSTSNSANADKFKLKFDKRSTSVMNCPRDNVLAIPKPSYQGKDFFQRPEFRGLLLADHQEIVGPRAYEMVEQLNTTTIS